MIDDKNLARLIAELRRRLGISQEKLAPSLRASLPTINRWEKGKTKPDGIALRTIEQFVRRLGPEYRDLLDGFTATDKQPALFAHPAVPQTRGRKGRGARVP